MVRKATGRRSVGHDGSVRVHGKASNGEGSVYLDADGFVPGDVRCSRQRPGGSEFVARRVRKRSLAGP